MVEEFRLDRLSEAPLHSSQITFDGKTWRSRRNHRVGGLVAFRGTYPSGSAGKDDARYIRWLLSEFYTLHRPDGLVVDCRGLHYDWGDDLDFPKRPLHDAEDFPLLIVLRPEQQEAFDFAVPRSEQRLELQAALAEVDEFIRAMKSLL
jgi:hypothetical protein